MKESNLVVSGITYALPGQSDTEFGIAFAEYKMCERTLRRLQTSLNKMPKSATHRPDYQKLQQSIHKAEVDLNYTYFFPLDREYLHIFQEGMPKDQSFDGPRHPLWHFFEKCMAEGKLQAFKDGQLDQELAVEGLILRPRIAMSKGSRYSPLLVERYNEHQKIPTESNGVALDEGNHKQGSEKDQQVHVGLALRNKSPQPEPKLQAQTEFNKGFTIALTPEPQFQRRGSDEAEESDSGVMLDIEDNDHESGEITEEDPPTHGGDGAGDEESDYELQYPVDIRGATGDTTDEDDAMQDYANADQATNRPEPTSPSTTFTRRPEYIHELSGDDFRAQIRYFYPTDTPETLDLGDFPIRCLVCAKIGHMAVECPALTCAECGAYNDHFVPFCPQKRKCAKCRGRGHDQSQCPSKLKLTASEIICDLCQDCGHTEDVCELIWRTSGLPKPLTMSNNRLRYIYCYECGKSGHLGNDCPTRQPGKRMGSRSWSLSGKAQQQIHQSKE